ncbi:MAG TPA: hypothetical protein PLV42_01050 [bacterium]|nr:hypothetical protein [bacterium]
MTTRKDIAKIGGMHCAMSAKRVEEALSSITVVLLSLRLKRFERDR